MVARAKGENKVAVDMYGAATICVSNDVHGDDDLNTIDKLIMLIT